MAIDGNNQNILQFPWFPKTEPPLAGGSQSGEWMGRDQQSLGTIANSLVYEVARSRVNSLPSPWSRALQFEQAVINPRYPTRKALLEELFGCFATVGLWEMYGVKLEAERVALLDHTPSKTKPLVHLQEVFLVPSPVERRRYLAYPMEVILGRACMF